MTTRNERLSRLAILSPCQEPWRAMSGGESSRFCSRCQKRVYDLSALEAGEVEALVEATQGRFCARITRDRFGRMVTRKPDPLPFHLPAAVSVRRAAPVVAAVVTAFVGLTGAGWAEAAVAVPVAVIGESVAPDLAHPAGPSGAVLDGRVVDDQGASLPGTTVVLRHSEEGWRFVAVTDAQGRFQLRDLPSGVYDVEAELEGFDFEVATGLALGPEGRQITFTGVASTADLVTVTMGETWVPTALPIDSVIRQSHLVAVATVGPSVMLGEPGLGASTRKVRTELRITSVLKGKPRAGTIQIERSVISGPPEDFLPGDAVLALLDPLGPGDGRPDSLVYNSADPIQALQSIPVDPLLRQQLGIDKAEWQAMRYIADALNDRALQTLVVRAIAEVEAARRQLAGDAAGKERLRARVAAVEEALRQRFVQVLSAHP
jgi:hypothetical protein